MIVSLIIHQKANVLLYVDSLKNLIWLSGDKRSPIDNKNFSGVFILFFFQCLVLSFVGRQLFKCTVDILSPYTSHRLTYKACIVKNISSKRFKKNLCLIGVLVQEHF